MHIRRMVSETVRKNAKRSGRHRNDGASGGSSHSGSVSKNSHKAVSFEVLQENGSAKKLHDGILAFLSFHFVHCSVVC